LQSGSALAKAASQKKLSKQRALVKSLTAKAIKGDARAMSILLNLMVRVLEVVDEAQESDLISEDDLAILDNFVARQKAQTGRKAAKPARKAGGARR